MEDNQKTRLSGADFAVRRRLIGLTLDEIAKEFGVNSRTVRSWESGQEPIPYRITEEIVTLLDRHDKLVAGLMASETDAGELPRRNGWHLAASAHAFAVSRTLNFDWKKDS